MEHVLITGGLGFIGSHAADAFLSAGNRVTVIDSTVASVIDGQDYDQRDDAKVIRCSVQDYFAGGGDFAGIDRVIHAASPVGPARIIADGGRLGPEIIGAAELVINECRARDIPLCIFSSAEVYGRSGELAESDDIRVPAGMNPRIEYAIAKVLTEAMALNSRIHGLRSIVIRPFNVGGSRQSREGGFVMPTFVQQALEGLPITVFANGTQERAFLAASDLSRFLTEHMDRALESDRAIYNLGNPDNRISVLDLADRVKTRLDSPSEVIFADGRAIHGPLYEEAESTVKVPVLDAALDVGWRPRVTLDELIDETADYYRRNRDVRGEHAPL